jgi:hypothetical protein
VIALSGLALPGCGDRAFVCLDSSECGNGTCEANGYCGFPDDGCPSGQRFGAHAPSSIANDCVDPTVPAEGTGEGSTSGAGTATLTSLDGSVGESATSTLESSAITTAETSSNGETSAPTSDADTASLDDAPRSDLPAELDCLVEDFDDGTIDGFSPWTTGPELLVADGVLEIALVSGPAAAGLDSPSMGFVERTLEVTLVAVPSQVEGPQVLFGITADGVDVLVLHEVGVLAVRYQDAESFMNLIEVEPYDGATRLRAWSHDGAIGFERRPADGGEWEPLWSDVAPFELADSHAYVVASTWEATRMPGSARFDDLSECPWQ